ncbi:MAG: CPBP family intramembrane glutamic endopeptidase [Flavobacteriaceae bacterium]
MNSKRYRIWEFFFLFILFPASLPLAYSIWVKLAIGLLGFSYIIWVLVRIEKVRFLYSGKMYWLPFWKRVFVLFPAIVAVTSLYVWWAAPQHFFYVPLHEPLLFVFILFVYSVFSVWPQELLYRTFFFKRYEDLFQNRSLVIFINATVFCLAHLFFRNFLVIVLTFIGGILFALTYVKFKSTTLVTLEHALYGNWIFTVGMGQMLGFPGMDGH